jgi:hypothetical protein
MPLTIGSVTVDGEGGHTGSGLTKRLVDATLATPAMAAMLATDGLTTAQKIEIIEAQAAYSQAQATAIIEEIQANAVVTVTIGTGDAGLQRLPASLVQDEPTKAPASPKTLGGTVA